MTNNKLLFNLISKDVISANSSVTRMSSNNTTTPTVLPLLLGQSSVNSATTNSSSNSLPAENLTIDFSGAGHDVEEDDTSEEEHSQNLLSPRRSTTTESSSMHTESPTMMHDSTTSTATTESTTNSTGEVYTEPADYEDEVDPIEILRGVIEDEAMYDKYQAAQINYRTMKTAMVEENTEVSVGKGVKKTTWNVVDDINESDLPDSIPYYKQEGIKGFDFSDKSVKQKNSRNDRINYNDLIIHLWPGDWRKQLDFVNDLIEEKQVLENDKEIGPRIKSVRRITQNEFWKFFGLLLVARLEGRKGTLWDSPSQEAPGILRKVNYSRFMSRTRFQEIRHYMAFVFADKTREGKDDWWQVLGGIDGLNENRKAVIQAGNIKVLDETMSAYRPRTTKTGTLPYLSFIMRKPEPLGTEFKTLAAGTIGTWFFRLEIVTKTKKY